MAVHGTRAVDKHTADRLRQTRWVHAVNDLESVVRALDHAIERISDEHWRNWRHVEDRPGLARAIDILHDEGLL